MRLLASRVALLSSLLASFACTDDGYVGAVLCEPACDADEICDRASGACVECEEEQGCEVADECDDCRADDAVCIARLCQACVIDADCSGAEERCIQNVCLELDDDSDDDGSGPVAGNGT
jgi:hypothetical protein